MKDLLYFLVLLLFSCTPDDYMDNENTTAEFCDYEVVDVILSEDPMEEIMYNGQKLMVQPYGDYYILEGDILIPIDHVNGKSTNKSVGRTTGLWPNNVVVYSIDPAISNKQRIYDAIKHWETNTNIKFVQRTSESDYVYFMYDSSGCASHIGKTGGKQTIWLADACSTGNTIHEIGHAVGLFHEQSRIDRDNYVKVLWENIQSGREHNFDKANVYGLPVKDLTPGLDFGSIMMYPPYAFSNNGQPTLVKLDGSTFNVQRSNLSVDDVKGISILYPAQTTPEPEPEPDTDGDGVFDKDDKCPNQYGPKENGGCPWPDTDGDGTLDKDDKCPSEVGPKENGGCPWPDTDKDGTLDKDDECPNEFGPASNGGCPEPEPEPEPDTDGDGILDKNDKCPTQVGPAENGGCPWPDTDKDGIVDKDDKCPNEYGPSANGGCPWPDTDKDGVLDKDDKCPNQAGPSANGGCPWPDTDGDGTLDKDDKCPNEAGPSSNGGCPEADADKDGVLDKDDKCPNEAGPASNGGCPVEPEPTEPEPSTTEYVNGTCYEIAGEVVLRNNDKWYMKRGKKWKEVELIDGKWRPVGGKKN